MAGETCETCADDCGVGGDPSLTDLDAEESSFLEIINEYRAQSKLNPLSACRSLNRAAQGHSEVMRDENFLAHEGADGSTPWQRACAACYELGCGPKTVMAENVAAGNEDAFRTFEQWRKSPGHNENMLRKGITQIGIGRALGGGKYGVYWTTLFGGEAEASCQ